MFSVQHYQACMIVWHKATRARAGFLRLGIYWMTLAKSGRLCSTAAAFCKMTASLRTILEKLRARKLPYHYFSPCHHQLTPHVPLACHVLSLHCKPQVAGNAVPWVASAPSGPFKRIDTRSFMIATTDLMSSYYVTLPKGKTEQELCCWLP